MKPVLLKEFVAYLHARERARLHPQQSGDQILDTYKFTNIRRAWDRTTRWLVVNWYTTEHASDPYVGQACAVARFVNWIPSLASLGYTNSAHWNRNHFVSRLTMRKNRGEKVFTGAHMIRGDTKKGVPKCITVADTYLQPVVISTVLRGTNLGTCRGIYRKLRTFAGWGPFMSQEVVQDLILAGPLASASDHETFVVAGPGAKKGLSWVFYGNAEHRWTDDDAVAAIREIWETLRRVKQGALAVPKTIQEDLTVHDIQFSLCEMSKYWKTRMKLGYPRSRYTPTTLED